MCSEAWQGILLGYLPPCQYLCREIVSRTFVTSRASNTTVSTDQPNESSRLLGISKQHLSHIENGRKVVSPERAASWAARLGYAESPGHQRLSPPVRLGRRHFQAITKGGSRAGAVDAAGRGSPQTLGGK